MKKLSAGILLYRKKANGLEFLIVHPGGPFWAKKDAGVWSIPKGLYSDEDPKEAACREFEEEIGQPVPAGEAIELGSIEQKNNKTVVAWAIEGDLDVSKIKSNTTMIDWPPRSGERMEIPEVDRAEWVTFEQASIKLHLEQLKFLKRLAEKLSVKVPGPKEPKQSTLF